MKLVDTFDGSHFEEHAIHVYCIDQWSEKFDSIEMDWFEHVLGPRANGKQCGTQWMVE